MLCKVHLPPTSGPDSFPRSARVSVRLHICVLLCVHASTRMCVWWGRGQASFLKHRCKPTFPSVLHCLSPRGACSSHAGWRHSWSSCCHSSCGCVHTQRPLLMGRQAVSRLVASKYYCQDHRIFLAVCPHLWGLFDTCRSDRASENGLRADRARRWALSRPDLCFGGAQEEWAFKREPCPLAVLPTPCHCLCSVDRRCSVGPDWALDLCLPDPSCPPAFLALGA